jgi:hypothetical protein
MFHFQTLVSCEYEAYKRRHKTNSRSATEEILRLQRSCNVTLKSTVEVAIQIGCEMHPAPIQRVPAALSPELERPEPKPDHPPLTNSEGKHK